MVLQDRLNVDRRFMKLTVKEMKVIKGGAGISSSIINALVRGVNSIMDVGRYLGSGIRRLIEKETCIMK